MTPKEFITKYKPYALETQRKTGISHLFILVTKGLFPEIISITKRADGKYLYVVRDWFRKYDTPEESFTDHAQFFIKNERYAEALKVKSDPYKFAEEVAKAGYATAPNYADTLKKVIKMIEQAK